ncbi:MAG: Gfo/Idh/MocA family protein [Caldicoprobacterales bacterium]|jgi:predicted dehydrogenase
MKVKVGVFGAKRGMSMIKIYLRHPDTDLVAVCDKSVEDLTRAAEAAEEVGKKVALYENFEDFFKHDMDAVVLANYATEHVPYAVRLLDSGRHILSEVPASETMAQAVELIEAVERTGLVYTFAENCCYFPAAFEMQRLYEQGELGEVMYAQGEYIHDSPPGKYTYGMKNHWRNRLYSTFYCTHSLGPILTITGRRPVQVVGFQTNEAVWKRRHGRKFAPGIEMVTLDNGAIVRSIHGSMKRAYGCKWMVFGTKGMAESDRFDDGKIHVFREGEVIGQGEFTSYSPQHSAVDMDLKTGHGNADLGAPHYFIQRILGRPEGYKYAIDVYTGVDMSICGILAYRSILNGNIPIKVPNLRNKEERDAYRNDHACTTISVAGDQLIPPYPDKSTYEEIYEYLSQLAAGDDE